MEINVVTISKWGQGGWGSVCTYQRRWGECAYLWSPEDSGRCSDTWIHWARLALSRESAPFPPAPCCHPASAPQPVSRWTAVLETLHSIHTPNPRGTQQKQREDKADEGGVRVVCLSVSDNRWIEMDTSVNNICSFFVWINDKLSLSLSKLHFTFSLTFLQP